MPLFPTLMQPPIGVLAGEEMRVGETSFNQFRISLLVNWFEAVLVLSGTLCREPGGRRRQLRSCGVACGTWCQLPYRSLKHG